MRIGLIDADLLDNGTRHPNLALMKISTYAKTKGYTTKLIEDYEELKYCNFHRIFLSKVFTKTNVPEDILSLHNIKYGGTGFFLDKAPFLPKEVEHIYPDYDLYTRYINSQLNKGIKRSYFKDYLDYSIGYTTRGCFRKCEFCVNKNYNKVSMHSPVKEFLNLSRKYILLLDDNVLGIYKWKNIFDELNDIGKRFQFEQGLDIRLLNKKRAKVLSESKWIGDFIFAFDFLKDKTIIEKHLALWRTFSNKTTKLYILSAFESTDVNDIISIFKRIEILFKYHCLPYNTRFPNWKSSPMRGMYININRWANQPNIVKKMSFNEFCNKHPKESSTMKYYLDFKKQYPEVVKQYFNIKFT